MVRRRRAPLFLSIVLVAATAIGAAATVSAAGTPREPAAKSPYRVAPLATNTSPITFSRPTIDAIQGHGDEQGMRVGPDGDIYATAINTLSSGTSWIWRSDDGGQTFKWVPGASEHIGKLFTCPGGGDSELAVDEGDHLYFNELTLANFSVSRSDDKGAHFEANCEGVLESAVDREWYATDGDATNGGNLYLTHNIIGADTPGCTGNISNLPNQLVLERSPIDDAGPSAGLQFAPPELVSGPCDEGIMGNVEVSPATHHIFIPHDNDALDAILVGRCETVPFEERPSGLQCVDLPVTSFPGYKTGANFPSLAIDKAGNLFVVWQMAPKNEDGTVTGDTLLYWSSSTDEGETWTPPVQIPTPGLHNNVFTWAAAGDDGLVDIAWYGTPAPVDPDNACVDPDNGAFGGPDAVSGDWTLYLTQTRNGTASTPSFTRPIVASEHFIHRGSMFTLIGGQCGDRSEGDFFQMRVGHQGEAQIVYGDTNYSGDGIVPRGMFVRQRSGPGVFAGTRVRGTALRTNRTGDEANDATFDYNGLTGHTQDNLDILSSSITRPDPDHYRIRMVVKDLTTLAPDPTTGNNDTTLKWLTQWFVPSKTDPEGGENFFAYMESAGGAPPTFWDGRPAFQLEGGGILLTYPGEHEITGRYTPTAPGTIEIDVPIANVTIEDPISPTLFNVTASTMTVQSSDDCTNVPCAGLFGGQPPNLIDPAPSYDWIPPFLRVDGHAHTDADRNGQAGAGDIHLDVDVRDDTRTAAPPAGRLTGYRDLRENPPGDQATGPFECLGGTPTFIGQPEEGPHVVVLGTVSCSGGLTGVSSFSLTVHDIGASDRYRMVLYDESGNAVYDSGPTRTTPGLGDLVVTVTIRTR